MDDYIWEKAHTAIRSLAGSGSKRERLLNACLYSVSLLEGKIFPDERASQLFNRIMQVITRTAPVSNEGQIAASINEKDDREVDETIDPIISLHDHVTRYMKPIL